MVLITLASTVGGVTIPERRSSAHGGVAAASLAALLASAGCDDGGQQARAEKPPDRREEAQRTATDRLLSGSRQPSAVQTRGVQAFPQAVADTVAVCGQVRFGGDREDAFLPFVSVVAPGRIEQHVAKTPREASRVYVEASSRCREGGGPYPRQNAPVPEPVPPIPVSFAPPKRTVVVAPSATAEAAAGAPTLPPGAVAAATARSATMRRSGKLRAAPAASAAVVGVIPRGTVLRVFGQAPGGWRRVGETEPAGWVHASLMDIAPP